MLVRVVRVGLVGLAFACAGPSTKQPKTVVIDEPPIEILDRISFVGDAELAATSHRTLDSVATELDGEPSIKLVEVQVHFADGDDATRQQIADRRAQAIVDYLIGKGVAAARLRSRGLVTPGDPRNSVAFVIIERS